jgi:hypothetical protein
MFSPFPYGDEGLGGHPVATEMHDYDGNDESDPLLDQLLLDHDDAHWLALSREASDGTDEGKDEIGADHLHDQVELW